MAISFVSPTLYHGDGNVKCNIAISSSDLGLIKGLRAFWAERSILGREVAPDQGAALEMPV